MSIIISNKAENFISGFVNKKINSPEQRLIQGATALVLQPLIDFKNRAADEDTRSVSVARTIGKILAGTIAGVTIRYAGIKLAKSFSKYTLTEGGKYLTEIKRKTKYDILLPEFDCSKIQIEKVDFINKYDKTIKNIGTALATIAMIFTNFLIDAPLTKVITKWLTPVVKQKVENSRFLSQEDRRSA